MVLTEDEAKAIGKAMRPAGGSRRLPAFSSGDPDEWTAFTHTFRRVADLKEWDEDARKSNLVAAFEGAAVRRVQHINANGLDAGGNVYTSETLLARYELCFVPASASHLAVGSFKAAKQGSREPILTWSTRLRELYVKAYPLQAATADTAGDLIYQFIIGLVHPTVRERTYQEHPATYTQVLDEATTKASDILVMRTVPGHLGAGSDPSVMGITADGCLLGTDDPNVGAVGGGGNPTNKSGQQLTCFACSSTAHMIRDCPDKERYEREKAGQGGRGGGQRGQRGQGGRRWGRGGRGPWRGAPDRSGGGARGGGVGAVGRGGNSSGGKKKTVTDKQVNALLDLLGNCDFGDAPDQEDSGN